MSGEKENSNGIEKKRGETWKKKNKNTKRNEETRGGSFGKKETRGGAPYLSWIARPGGLAPACLMQQIG
jgi:hypothetical protein